MSNLIILDSAREIAECNDCDSLLAALRSCASDILRNLSRMAAILQRLDELGVQVEIEHALLPYIRMIANGSLSAECFIACSGDPSLLTLATKFPADLQKKIAANEPFRIFDADGKSKEVPVLEMTQQEVTQAFVSGRERTDHEKLLAAKRAANYGRNSTGISTKSLPSNVRNATTNRCQKCGTKLYEGSECISCNLKDEKSLADLKRKESLYDEITGHSGGESPPDDDDDGIGQLPDGWQERLAELRQIKEHGNEVGFHVDWLLNYMSHLGIDDTADATLYPLLEKLASHFGHELETIV